MIEILDDIASLEIKGDGTKSVLILCDRLERFMYGISGYKTKKGIFGSEEQVLIIHTNIIKETEDEFIHRTGVNCHIPSLNKTILQAEFNSIKEVLDSLGIFIHYKRQP